MGKKDISVKSQVDRCSVIVKKVHDGILKFHKEDYSDIQSMNTDVMKNRNIHTPDKELDFLKTPSKQIIEFLNNSSKDTEEDFINSPLFFIMNPPYREHLKLVRFQ